MKKLFEALYHHQLLDYTDAKEILIRIAQGDLNPSQIASFLTVFMMRGVTVQELSGFRDALMELCLPIDFDGIETSPEGLEDISKMGVITKEMQNRGFNTHEIKLILGENFMRVFKTVENLKTK